MNYYRFALDEPRRTHFSEFAPPPEIREQAWLALYVGQRANLTSPLIFTRVIRGGGRPEDLKDLLHSTISPLLVSERLLTVLEPFIHEAQAFESHITYKNRVEATNYRCLNVLTVVDCFDFRRSTYLFRLAGSASRSKERRYGNPLTSWYLWWRVKELRTKECQVGYVYNPVLRSSDIPAGCDVFRVGAVEGQYLFVSENVRQAVTRAGCSGVAFAPVRTS